MADQIEQMGITIENHQKASFISNSNCITVSLQVATVASWFQFFVVNEQQLEELQARYDAQVQECLDLRTKLESTQVTLCLQILCAVSRCWSTNWVVLQKDLYRTTKLLAITEEELRRSQYTLEERDYYISEQKKAGRFMDDCISNVGSWMIVFQMVL